jgi:cytidyltransferase-like protein
MTYSNTLNKHLVVIYAGRFQPFHQGHADVYHELCNRFGDKHTFIVASNKTNQEDSPFTFEQKKMLACTLFRIPQDKFVYVKQPYRANELLDSFDPSQTSVIWVTGAKDHDRLTTGKMVEWSPELTELQTMNHLQYVYRSSPKQNGLSATFIRHAVQTASSMKQKRHILNQLYPHMTQQAFDVIIQALSTHK